MSFSISIWKFQRNYSRTVEDDVCPKCRTLLTQCDGVISDRTGGILSINLLFPLRIKTGLKSAKYSQEYTNVFDTVFEFNKLYWS